MNGRSKNKIKRRSDSPRLSWRSLVLADHSFVPQRLSIQNKYVYICVFFVVDKKCCYLATTVSVTWVTNRRVVERSDLITSANLASSHTQFIMVRGASITFITDYTRLTSTFTVGVALDIFRPERITLTVDTTHFVLAPIKPMFALFAVLTCCVAFAFITVASVACQLIQCLIEVAFFRQSVTRARLNLKKKLVKRLLLILSYICPYVCIHGHRIEWPEPKVRHYRTVSIARNLLQPCYAHTCILDDLQSLLVVRKRSCLHGRCICILSIFLRQYKFWVNKRK